MSLDEVKANWANELGRFKDRPEAIAYALENLPAEQPPTVLQFRALCAAAPVAYEAPALPAPDPQGLRRIADALRLALADHQAKPLTLRAKECLDRLQARVDDGTASVAQRDFLRRARAGLGIVDVGAIGDFTPIPRSYWPAGMQQDLAASEPQP
jgi:hypothetical protein